MNAATRHLKREFDIRAVRLAALVGVWMIAALLSAAADPPPLPEHQIKALYLFNFSKYVDWPEDAFSPTNNSYVIGIAGAPEIYQDLLELSSNKTVNGRKLVVRQIDRAADAVNCHIVYFGPGAEKLADETLETVRQAPVLTVGEQEDFISRGGVVRFAREQDKLRLEISLEASHAARLTVSARLLPIAKVIRGAHSAAAQ